MEQPLLDQGARALPLDATTAPSLPLWWLVFISLYYVPIMLSWQLLGAIMLPKAVHQVEIIAQIAYSDHNTNTYTLYPHLF